ncbi:MAG: NADH-quinone oxidoreductase subunit NuoK [Helicobacteraceae bacterium]
MITLHHYIVLSVMIFFIGLYGVLTRKNLLMLLFSTEIMLNAINIAFVAIGTFYGDLSGQMFALFIIAIAASEVAVGLGLLIVLFKRKKSLDLDNLNKMFG